MFRITQSWAWDSYPTQKLPYDMHTWTLPVEMSMSMLLFITITGLGRCKVPLRFVIVLGMMWYCFGSGHWAAIEFLGGALIAELGLIQDQGKSSSRTSTPSETAPTNPGTDNRIAWTCFWWIQFVIAMWICGWPNHDVDQASGIAWMQDLTPEPYFSRGEDGVVDWKAYPWFVLASLQLVLACHQLPPLQRVLTTAPIQYLGSIGFALYLIHGPMMECLGWRTMNPIWNCVGGQGNAGIWGLLFGWVAGVFGMGIPSLWAADLFWRFVDRPCVNIARWLERKCIEKHD